MIYKPVGEVAAISDWNPNDTMNSFCAAMECYSEANALDYAITDNKIQPVHVQFEK